MAEALFTLGQIVATPGALAALEEAHGNPAPYIRRHVTGDWGAIGNWADVRVSPYELAHGALATADDARLNAVSILHNAGRVLSSYTLQTGVTLWIITDGLGMAGETYTTLLLPEEY